MSLDPDNQKILDMMKEAGRPPVNELQPDEARKMYRASRGALQPELPDVAELRDLSAPGRPVIFHYGSTAGSGPSRDHFPPRILPRRRLRHWRSRHPRLCLPEDRKCRAMLRHCR